MSAFPKTVFVGLGNQMVSYYRCFLPAVALGVDYVGWGATHADGAGLALVGGLGPRTLQIEELFEYDVVIVQQPRGRQWLKLIRELQASETTVLFEIDDYLRGARKDERHELSATFDGELLRSMELLMEISDGIICSTDYLARRYRKFNARTWACYNGIDLPRYAHPRAPGDGVTIGWAGGVGHRKSLERWAPALREVLRARPETRFMSAGHAAAAGYVEEFGPERAISVPPAQLEVYPATLSLFDVGIAPSAENNLFRGKSDLRWLEASAAGVPLVAHPDVYPEIEDGVTGVHARTPAEVEAALIDLIDDREKREWIGAQAHAYVAEHRSAAVTGERWREVLLDVAPVGV